MLLPTLAVVASSTAIASTATRSLTVNVDLFAASEPSIVVASVGDRVVVQFSETHPHTVPCGIFGLDGVDIGMTTPSSTHYVVDIEDSEPLWVYCNIGDNSSILASINPPSWAYADGHLTHDVSNNDHAQQILNDPGHS